MPGLFDSLSQLAQPVNTALGGIPGALLGVLNQPQVKPLLGLAAAAPLVDLIVQGVNRKRDEPRARGGAWRMFGQLAMNELLRPRQIKDELLKSQLASGQLTAMPVPGAQPTENWAGSPLYAQPTLAQTQPDLFTPQATAAQWQIPEGGNAMVQPPAPVIAGATSWTQYDTPTTTPVSPALQMIGGLPGTPANRMALAQMLAKNRSNKLTMARPGLYVLDEAGNVVTRVPGEEKSSRLTMADLAQQYLSPEQMPQYLLKQGGAGKPPPVRRSMRTGPNGEQLYVEEMWDAAQGRYVPRVDDRGNPIGGSRFNQNDPQSRLAAAWLTEPLRKEILDLTKRVGRLKNSAGDPKRIQEIEATLAAKQQQLASYLQEMGVPMPPLGGIGDVESKMAEQLNSYE